jgi:hypothetical protein
MKNRIPLGSAPDLLPSTKMEVMDIARGWYNPNIVRVDESVIEGLNLPKVETGADPGMAKGKMEINFHEVISLSIALNSINYQFWGLDEKGALLRYDFEGIVGAAGMRTAFERAWRDPDSALSLARQGRPLTEGDVRKIFGEIPNIASRVTVLNEVLCGPKLDELTQSLTEEIGETSAVCVYMAKNIANAFPLAYGDQVLKKAQLALSEIWVFLESKAPGHDCELTAFADYQIPNVLRAMGVLKYSDELAQKIANHEGIPYGSVEERAIRGASLLAVEKIAERAGRPVAAVDHYLWMRRKEATDPFHLTFTTAY